MFGVGAAVVPIIGGVPAIAAEARLIEVPRLKFGDSVLVGQAMLPSEALMNGPLSVSFIVQTGNKKMVVQGRSVVFNCEYGYRDFGDIRSVVTSQRMFWKMEGELIQHNGNLLTVTQYDK